MKGHMVSPKILWIITLLMAVTVFSKWDSSESKVKTDTTTASVIDNQDDTVTDTLTGLQWMRCTIGQVWNNNHCEGTVTTHQWHDAIAMKDHFAGYSDWRLPTIKELNSLVLCSNGKQIAFKRDGYDSSETEGWDGCDSNMRSRDFTIPTIDQKVFPNSSDDVYWSSTTWYETDSAWGVAFTLGADDGYKKAFRLPVRLVRTASPATPSSSR
jgi:hypothetical protein